MPQVKFEGNEEGVNAMAASNTVKRRAIIPAVAGKIAVVRRPDLTLVVLMCR